MKRHIPFAAVIALVLCSTVMLGARAQDEGTKPALSMIVIEHVKPSMIMQYEEAIKEMIALFDDHNVSPEQATFHTATGPELGYVYVMPIEEFGDIDRMYAEQGAIIQSVGAERFLEIVAKSDACIDSREVVHSRYREDLSYHPAEPRISDDEIGFIHYSFLYVIPGHEQEFEQMARDFAALYAEKGITDAWSAHQVLTGSDLPLYVFADYAKSASDFFTQMEKNEAALGLAGMELMLDGMSHIRSIVQKTGVMRPDLSYPPMPEAEAEGGN